MKFKKIKKMRLRDRIPLRMRFTALMIIMTLIPGVLLTVLYFSNIREFYEEKIEVYQINALENMKGNLENITHQKDVVTEQLLGLSINSSMYGGYDSMTSYEKLLLYRQINGLLTNILISNDYVDNVYMLGYEDNFYTSNKESNLEEFLKCEWIEKREKSLKGITIVIPTHEAKYRYSNSLASPKVISYVTYLNRNSVNKAIDVIQIDLNYKKIQETMDYMGTSEVDGIFVVDSANTVIFAFNEDIVGMNTEEVKIADVTLEQAVSGDNELIEKRKGITIRMAEVEDSDWKIIQINSDMMLESELDKFKSIWATVVILGMLVAVLIAVSLSIGVTKPIERIIKSMKKVSAGDFNTKVEEVHDKSLSELVESFNFMVLEIEKLMKDNLKKERERLTMELMALNGQINSHFLYNTLNAIKWMALSKGEEDIAKAIVSLVKMLEYSYKNLDSNVKIFDELQFIKDYIYIQRIRYKKAISFEIEIEKDLLEYMIPKMLFQPIIENAVIHGFRNIENDNRILLKITRGNGSIKIKFCDNGQGFMDVDLDKMTGVGLKNIQDRLKLNFGEKYEVIISSKTNKGTCISFEIPDLNFLEGNSHV